MMANIWELSALDLIFAYRKGALSPVEVMEAVLDRVERLNPIINAFREVDRPGALASARASEKRWSDHAPMGRLDGVPVSGLDLRCKIGAIWQR
jgi:aspartyl-tRNA(Asn)/glutamyl-tRNA(Gln) amidotransferase subunit A